MANQTDVQQLIQGLSSGSNNGNPNTAYNNAPGIPMADAQGNWFLQNLPTAASLNMGSRGGGGMPVLPSLPPLTSGGGGGGWGFPPPTTTTPPVTPPVAGGGGQPGPGSAVVGQPSLSAGGTGGYNQTHTGNNFGIIGSQYTGAFGTGGVNNATANWGNGLSWTELGQNSGQNGLLGNVLQIADMVSEPWLPGDLVQNGELNWRAFGDAVAMRLGIPVAQAAALIGKGDQYQAWLAGGHAQMPGNLRFGPTSLGNSEGWGFGEVNPLSGQLSLGLLDQGLIPQSSGVPTADSFDRASALTQAFGAQANNPGPSPGAMGGTGALNAGVVGGYFVNPATGQWEFSDAGQQMFSAMRGDNASGKSGGNAGNIRGHLYEK